jgi:glycosyltransferase involved in cell wall biosynthesis
MQTVRPKKIVFIDDCSTDGSFEFAEKLLADSDIKVELYKNETNSGSVFRQWLNGLDRVDTELVWIAETDDYSDFDFLEKMLPLFADEQILGAFSRIICVDENGSEIQDLANYFDGMDNFSWDSPSLIPAAKLFSGDFVEKNVIPNASGFVFRRPILNDREKQRLLQYRFAGDWYFYSLILRGGSLAYVPEAVSFFRRSTGGASRSVFFTDLHVREHQMVLSDINDNYSLSRESLLRHAECLAKYVSVEQVDTIRTMSFSDCEARPHRICIAANGFSVGGGEIVPVELANSLKEMGCHVTYLVMEAVVEGTENVRNRLRSDIAVVYWADVRSDFNRFLFDYGIDVINSHNVSFDYAAYCSGLEIKVPYVASLHGGYETVRHLLDGDFSRYLGRTVTKWMYLAEKNVDVLLASGISPAGFVKVFNALPVQNVAVQRGDVRRQLGIPEEAFVLVQCSRAIREKGWEISIESTKLARALLDSDVHLVFIGSGPLLEEISEKYSHFDWVHFMGHVDSPRRFICDFDMAIFPSRFLGETFPLFLLESIACGLPCVATDIGEISSILASGSDFAAGLVVPADIGDRQLVSAMTDSIVSVLSDPVFYRDLKEGARRQSDVFSMARLLRIYLSTFDDVRQPSHQ